MQQHYFIGIKMPSQVAGLADKYRRQYHLEDHYKVLPHQYDLHMTLLFLGAIGNKYLPAMKERLEDIAANVIPFSLYLNGLSYFGSSVGPRVIYLSVVENEILHKLQSKLNMSVCTLLSRERSDQFVPHVTIAKKRKTTAGLPICKHKIEALEIPITSFSLFKIYPKETPKYHETATFKLEG